MGLKLQLTSERPGYGRIQIRNLSADGELQFSFQRSSDRHFLGAGQQWQPTVHWHAVGGAEAADGECSALLGPEIIDGLLQSSSDNMLVSVRGGGVSDQGVMRIPGRLLGSDAAGATPQTAAVTTTDSEIGAPGGETGEEETVDEPQVRPPPPPPPPPVPSRRWLWVLLAVLVLLAALAAAWYFGLLGLHGLPGSGDSVKESEVGPDADSAGDGAISAESAPALKGRPRAQAYLVGEQHPAPQAMFDQATDWESEGDCEAAMIVYQLAAQSDADTAARYARRYDPDTFETSGCIGTADAETAAYWYEGPAKAGDVEAQRQLGKILVEKYASGVLRDQGETWLTRAAQAGDKEALALVKKLGIGDN